MNELTEEEQIYYANYALVDVCDCCGKYIPITNRNDNEDYLTYTGSQLLCQKCLN